MKHWKLSDALKLKLGNSHVPAPFPGKWPTRICWAVSRANGIIGLYLGKPNAEQVKRLLKVAGLDGEWTALEFDQKHLIYIDSDSRVQANRLYDAYHPWTSPAPLLGQFVRPVFHKNIGGFRCYSPHETLQRAYIDRYKLWMLEFTGKRLLSAEERASAKAERLRLIRVQREARRAVPGAAMLERNVYRWGAFEEEGQNDR